MSDASPLPARPAAGSVCVVTGYDDRFAPMGDLAAARLRAYAARHGFACHVERKLSTGRPPAWDKIVVLSALAMKGYAWLFWVDADALILDLEADIRGEIRADVDLYLCAHHTWVEPMPAVAVRYDVPNTGVMLMRTGPWLSGFLTEVWEQDSYLEHPWWENAAIIHLMGYGRLLDPAGVNAPRAEVMDHVAWLGWQWNSVPGESDVAHPVIRHYTRRGDFETRLAEMRADLAALEGNGGRAP